MASKDIIESLKKTEILDKFKEITKPIIEKLNEIVEKAQSKKSFKIAMLTHDNPDADATSSLIAILRYLRKQGIENITIFANEESVSRETKVIKNKLGIDIKPLKEFSKRKYKAIILIDIESMDQSNIKIKPGYKPDLVLDHHNDESPFGATATIVTILLTILKYEIEKDLATALTVGIKTDTNDMSSTKVSKFDVLAYRQILAPLINDHLLKEIEKSGYSASYRTMLVNALDKYRFQEGSTVISGVGYIKPNQRTDLAKIANFLLEEEGIEKVIVLAIVENEIRDEEGNIIKHEKFVVPAARASTPTEDIGDLNKKVFGERAGGDSTKASGEIPLTDNEIKDIERAKQDDNHELLTGYFLDTLNRYKEKILEQETK